MCWQRRIQCGLTNTFRGRTLINKQARAKFYTNMAVQAEIRDLAFEPFGSTGHFYLDDLREVAIIEAFFCGDKLFRIPGSKLPGVKHLPVLAGGGQVARFLELLDRHPDSGVLRYGKCLFDFWDGQYFKAGDSFQALAAEHPGFVPVETGPRWIECGLLQNVPDKPCDGYHGGKMPRPSSPIKVHFGGGSMGKSIFMYSDGLYFEMFAKNLVESMRGMPIFKGVYLHVTNPRGLFEKTCDEIIALSKQNQMNLTISTDSACPKSERGYYVCARLPLLIQIQKQTGDDYFCIDAEAMYNRKHKHVFSGSIFPGGKPWLAKKHPGFKPGNKHIRHGGYLPWTYCAGDYYWLPACDRTDQFLEKCAWYLDNVWSSSRESHWWVDQLALFYACLSVFGPDKVSDMHWPTSIPFVIDADKVKLGSQHPEVKQCMEKHNIRYHSAVYRIQNQF